MLPITAEIGINTELMATGEFDSSCTGMVHVSVTVSHSMNHE